jgi:hypothetical protein
MIVKISLTALCAPSVLLSARLKNRKFDCIFSSLLTVSTRIRNFSGVTASGEMAVPTPRRFTIQPFIL